VDEARMASVDEEIRLLREENRRLKIENGSQSISIVELQDSLFHMRTKMDSLADTQKREIQRVKDEAQGKIQLLKDKNTAGTQEIAAKDRFLTQVKTSYKKNETGVVNAESLIEMGKEFLLEYSVFLPSLWRDVSGLKNPVLLKKLGDFRREFDKLQIAFQKYAPVKGGVPRGTERARKTPATNNSGQKSVRNQSFCSVSSIASGRIGQNQSRMSISSAKMSFKSRGSVVSSRSRGSAKTPKKIPGPHLETQLKKELEDLKNTYKKLIVLTSPGSDDDPLVRERLNLCVADIQKKTKLLMQTRKGGLN